MNTEVIKLFGILERAWKEKKGIDFFTDIEEEILIILIDKQILNRKAFYWSHEKIHYSGNFTPIKTEVHSTITKGSASF
jgi:hypothetical protein